jgi:hypothetical protein
VVNGKGEVVTLHYGSAFDSQLKVNKGLELPIEPVLATFVAQGFPIKMAVGTALGVVFTVPGATTVALPQELVPALAGRPVGDTVRVPVEAAWLPAVPIPAPDLLAGLERQLDATAAGRQLLTLWLRHHRELLTLLDTHRRVALVWHRWGGPALLQMFLRMTADHALVMPRTINGRPLSDAFHRIADAFASYATPDLRRDLAGARAALPELGGMTYPQILTAFGRR